MLSFILIVAGLAIVAVLGYAATRPDTFRVQRATRIAATPEQIYPWIEDLRANEQWSPYYRKDPAMKSVYGGPTRGVGASVEFEGNREVGSGRVTITGSTPHRLVRMRLQMFKPIKGDNVVEYVLVPTGTGTTEVTWALNGHQPFLGKVISLVFDMDKMIGADFAAGLANLKSLVEGRAPRVVTNEYTAPLGAPHAT